MNDVGVDGDMTEVSTPSLPTQACTMLKDAREAQGLHIAALAVALKVPVRKLEALEAGRFDQLPDMVFVRSLALSVCRALKIDPAPIMASLPEPQFNQFKVNEAGLNTTFKDAPGTSRRGFMAQLSSPIGLGVLFLMVAIAAILAWPVRPIFEEEAEAPKDVTAPAAAVEPVAQLPQTTGSAVETPSAVASAPVVAPQPAVVESPTAPASKTISVASASTPVSVATTEVATPNAVLELNGQGESWVEVTDATGQSKLRKLIQSGEVIRVNGQLPLSVVVGRADKVSVNVRGKPLDLMPMARENVARFEVK